MPPPSRGGGPLIKGYLPVRLRLPKIPQLAVAQAVHDHEDHSTVLSTTTEETYFYVREHQQQQGATSKKADAHGVSSPTTGSGCTLFVANAPVVPGISTKLLLRSLLGRFADVTRVAVVSNPRRHGGSGGETTTTTTTTSIIMGGEDALLSSSSLGSWTDKVIARPSFLPPVLSEGTYAHVIFATPKEMKKAKKALEDLMSGSVSGTPGSASKRRNHKKRSHQSILNEDAEMNESSLPPALTLDSIEIQTLSDESMRQFHEARRRTMGNNDNDDDLDDDDDDDDQATRKNLSGVLAIAQRYRDSCKLLSRDKLLEECNAVMQAFEEAEEAKRLTQGAARSQPDDDGFVTVSYSNAVGSKSELEESVTATTPSRRKGNKRTRKKKDAIGSQQLQDFYRFQRKEGRKRSMEDLRKQFQVDLQKVKRLKEEKQYRPF